MQGIYHIKCLQESKVYIGSSIDIERRWSEHKHKLSKSVHHNTELQLSWDAYGDESFIFEVLEKTTDLVEREQHWLDNSSIELYNSSKHANNPQRNPDTIKKISDTMYAKYGTKSKGGKFSESEVLTIIERLNSGESPTNIATDLNVHYSSIYYIKNGKNWSQFYHLVNLPKKPREKVFDWLAEGLDRTTIYNLLEGKHDRSTIWNWEKAYKKQRLK